jgi:hypothetical protein
MKKPAKKKLVLDRDTVRTLDTELETVRGGGTPCTADSSCLCGLPVHTLRCIGIG